ncbi:MAG: arginine--tRNA ligase [Candidatus Woesearchaeota archaeon]
MNKAEQEIIKLLRKETKLKEINLEVPKDSSLGDYAFPCFQLSKQYKQNPIEIAMDLAKKLSLPKSVKEIREVGPYLNFFVDKQAIASDVIKNAQKEDYGKAKDKKKTYMIEYFHANTHKGVHIGHMRNISMAEALCRILENAGYKILRVNYQGDIGPHVAKCLWGYLNLKEKEPLTHKGTWLGKIYSKAHLKSQVDPQVEEQIKEINNKLYEKSPDVMEVWQKTRKYCLDDFNDFYKEFGIKFNKFYFESEAEGVGIEIVNKMLEKGSAKEDDGAIIIDLDDLGIYVLLTQDGNALYSTKDLGLAQLKQDEFKFDKSIHVTGAEQILHFKQLFKTLEILKSPMAKKSMHIPYGLVVLPEGKMSSREGTMVLFDELREKLITEAEKGIKSRHKDLTKKEIDKRKMQIAYSALKFSMINRENNKDIVFDWEKALDFEGETGPYIQYAHARISSILKKYGKAVQQKIKSAALDTDEDAKLILLLTKFPEKVEESAKSYKPHLVARYLLDLAQAFNEFYHACPILQSDEDTKLARLNLILAVQQVLKNGLNLLGIEAPEAM